MDLSDAVIVRSGRLKSVVWNDFDRVRKGDTYLAICRHCKKRLSGSSASGTSHLRNHLIRCQRRTNNGISQYYLGSGKKKEERLTLANHNLEQRKDEMLSAVNVRYEHEQTEDDGVITVASTNLDQRRSRFDLARMIILHGYPLTMVEDVGFRAFVRNLQPLFELVAFERVESDCMEIYAKEKHKIFEALDKLPGKICISVDVWNSSDDSEFLCLKAHYIDETWGFKQRVLNFFMVDPSHTPEMHAEVIMTCLMEWDIDRKLFSMTSNHSPPYSEEVTNKIRDRLSQNKFLYCNGQLFDVSCAMNVLSRMAQDVLQSCGEMINKIRECIRVIKSSESLQEKFNRLNIEAGIESETNFNIFLDNPTRWDSTYTMLEVVLDRKNVFCLMKERCPEFRTCPSGMEWERLGTITGFLKLFVEVTNIFTKNKYIPANKYFPEICDVHLRLIEWSKNPDEFISFVVTTTRKTFDEYWEKSNMPLAIATIMDPRYKMKLIEYYYPLLYGASASELIEDISKCVKTLYTEHSVGSLLASSDQTLDWPQPNGTHRKEFVDRLTEFDRFISETTSSQDTKSDLEKYLEEPLFPRNSDLDVLNWWKVHTPRYPILSTMARNVLAVPMSKVSPEVVFETGRRQVDQNWCLLRPSTVQALMCAQDWIRSELES